MDNPPDQFIDDNTRNRIAHPFDTRQDAGRAFSSIHYPTTNSKKTIDPGIIGDSWSRSHQHASRGQGEPHRRVQQS